ncbi:MAG TPA: hypothetical protein VFZ76_15165 [Anaerolineales bacterium]
MLEAHGGPVAGEGVGVAGERGWIADPPLGDGVQGLAHGAAAGGGLEAGEVDGGGVGNLMINLYVFWVNQA